jgi:hypothetical protein
MLEILKSRSNEIQIIESVLHQISTKAVEAVMVFMEKSIYGLT